MEATLNPQALFGLFFDFIRTGVLKAAVDLELFTHIANGQQTAAAVARAAQADERGVRIVLDALTAQGVLTKDDGHYGLTPTAEMFLVKGTPTYAGGFTRIAVNPHVWQAVGQLADIVRSGKPPEAMIDVPEHDFWVEFSQASEQISQLPAQVLADTLALDPAQPAEVLDVACGAGVYGFTVLERCPKARVTALDWHNVLQQARRLAERRGIAERVTWLAGSAFETPLPPVRYDAAIVSQFYHHFSPAQNIALSERLFAALKPGGRLAVHDFVPDDARRRHERALTFAVVMLASTPQGDVYTFPQYREMLTAAGFTDISQHEVPMAGSQVIVAQRPR